MWHFTDFTGHVLFIITSFLAGVESTDQCLLKSKVLSCFSGVRMSIRSFFLYSGAFLFLNGIIGNKNGESYAKHIAFYKTHSGLGLAISKAYNGSYVSVANDDSTLIFLDYRFPTQKSNCTIMNKWHVISVTWSNRKNLSNCWSNGEKLITFNTGNIKGSDHCFIRDLGIMPTNTYLIGCVGEIIGFYRTLTDKETSYIHKYLMKKWT